MMNDRLYGALTSQHDRSVSGVRAESSRGTGHVDSVGLIGRTGPWVIRREGYAVTGGSVPILKRAATCTTTIGRKATAPGAQGR